MCIGKPRVPEVKPPPAPQAPNATPNLRGLMQDIQQAGTTVDPITGRRKRGLTSLRIDKQSPTTGLQVGQGE